MAHVSLVLQFLLVSMDGGQVSVQAVKIDSSILQWELRMESVQQFPRPIHGPRVFHRHQNLVNPLKSWRYVLLSAHGPHGPPVVQGSSPRNDMNNSQQFTLSTKLDATRKLIVM